MTQAERTDPVFTGVGVALATLFDDDLNVDVAATVDHATRLVEAGVRAVVVAGSTGEAAALDADERAQLVAKVRGALPAEVPVLAGTGAASARQAVSLSRAAVDAGADAVLVLSPPLAGDPRPYYAEVSAAVDVSVLGYHFPAVSQPGIPMAVLADLPVNGLKDSSGDPDRLLETLELFPGPLYTGSSGVLSLAGPAGCAGAILALANVEPERCIRALAGDGTAQREVAPAHLAAKKAFPRALKELMAARWGTATHTRMG